MSERFTDHVEKPEPYSRAANGVARSIRPLNARFSAARAVSNETARKAQIIMPVFRYSLIPVSGFLASLFVYDACFGFANDVTSPASVVALRWPDIDEFRLTKNAAHVSPAAMTPAARVRETFAMFLPGDHRRMRDTARPLAGAVGRQG
ncbi:hypothetical protein [Bradyrhizobium sp. ISRA463]|nr:hypothetical protein [Bradyrhizobium sp. ISRA463]WGS20560.1 hypothetical protein MTX22_01610 [Bradyrhizobium sp. ISRA463]